MKALVLAPMTPQSLALLRALATVTYESWSETLRLADPEELGRRIASEGYAILVVEADFLPHELFQIAAGLRLVAVARNSVAHVDLTSATRHGVAVVNTPGRNAQAVAELTIGLMLALARRISYLDSYVKSGQWESPWEPYTSPGMRGAELAGKTLGIVGLGRIGCRVARLAQGFDMRVLAYDPYLREPPAGQNFSDAPSRIDDLVDDLTDLVSQADYISVHVPDTPETQGLLSREHLAAAKASCRIINTSAYHAVDETALVDALQAGHLAGAAFDVFPTHPITPNNPLLNLDNVVLTPHIGGATEETIARHSMMIVEDIERFLGGQIPLRIVNPEVWPELWPEVSATVG